MRAQLCSACCFYCCRGGRLNQSASPGLAPEWLQVSPCEKPQRVCVRRGVRVVSPSLGQGAGELPLGSSPGVMGPTQNYPVIEHPTPPSPISKQPPPPSLHRMLLVHEVKPSLGLAFGSEQRIINVECTPDASWIWGHVLMFS